MTGEVEARLAELGISLPTPAAPVANYVPHVRSGALLFVSGQIARDASGPITGQLGPADQAEGAPAPGTPLARAVEAARVAGLHLIGQAKDGAGGLDRIARVLKLTVFVNSAPGFTQQPVVANGCSDLMVEVFGDAGRHSRSAVGVSALPLGVLVEIEGVFEVR